MSNYLVSFPLNFESELAQRISTEVYMLDCHFGSGDFHIQEGWKIISLVLP